MGVPKVNIEKLGPLERKSAPLELGDRRATRHWNAKVFHWTVGNDARTLRPPQAAHWSTNALQWTEFFNMHIWGIPPCVLNRARGP